MNLNQIELQKTAILFFDILNGYYHEAGETAKARKKPMVAIGRLSSVQRSPGNSGTETVLLDVTEGREMGNGTRQRVKHRFTVGMERGKYNHVIELFRKIIGE